MQRVRYLFSQSMMVSAHLQAPHLGVAHRAGAAVIHGSAAQPTLQRPLISLRDFVGRPAQAINSTGSRQLPPSCSSTLWQANSLQVRSPSVSTVHNACCMQAACRPAVAWQQDRVQHCSAALQAVPHLQSQLLSFGNLPSRPHSNSSSTAGSRKRTRAVTRSGQGTQAVVQSSEKEHSKQLNGKSGDIDQAVSEVSEATPAGRVGAAMRNAFQLYYSSIIYNTIWRLARLLGAGEFFQRITPGLENAYATLSGTWHVLGDGSRIPVSLANNYDPDFSIPDHYDPKEFPFVGTAGTKPHGYDGRVAHLMALCMKLVYESQPAAYDIVTRRWGLEFLEFFQTPPVVVDDPRTSRDETVFVPSSKAFMCASADAVIVSFRGTEATNLINWHTNLTLLMAHEAGMGGVHHGFHSALFYRPDADSWDSLSDWPLSESGDSISSFSTDASLNSSSESLASAASLQSLDTAEYELESAQPPLSALAAFSRRQGQLTAERPPRQQLNGAGEWAGSWEGQQQQQQRQQQSEVSTGGTPLCLFDQIVRSIRAALENEGGGGGRRYIYLTGHSMGAALASVFAQALLLEAPELSEKVAGIYLFGSPRVGDKTFRRVFMDAYGDRAFRLAHAADIVPHFPPKLLGYRHLGQEMLLTSFWNLKTCRKDIQRWRTIETWGFLLLYLYKIPAGSLVRGEGWLRTLYRVVFLVVMPGLVDHFPCEYERITRGLLDKPPRAEATVGVDEPKKS